jgi:TRAP-type C4-dicarboxylate transport system permease small subunit
MTEGKPDRRPPGRPAGIGTWLRRVAEWVAAALLGVMFVSFIVQIAFRYLLNLPTGWSSEVTVICWLWLVLWGAAFVVREREEIRFDIVYGSVSPPARRAMAVLTAVALIVLYGWSFPAVWDYVTFMKVQRTAYLGIRYDWLYSIYILFALAALARYAWILWASLRGVDPEPEPWTGDGSP